MNQTEVLKMLKSKIDNAIIHNCNYVIETGDIEAINKALETPNSEEIIGSVQQRYNELEHKNWNWFSFYNGWIEGRVNLIKGK